MTNRLHKCSVGSSAIICLNTTTLHIHAVGAMAPKPKSKPVGKVDMVEPFVRGRASVKNFFDELEQETGTPAADLKRIFDGLHKLAVRGLKSKHSFSIPAMGLFRVIAKPSATEAPMVIMDRRLVRRERPCKSKVTCKVAPALNDKVVA